MTDPRLLLTDARLDEIERDAAHSRRLGLTVTFAVVNEQLAFVHELRRLRHELAEARAESERLRAPAQGQKSPRPSPQQPVRRPPNTAAPRENVRHAPPIREPERNPLHAPTKLDIEVVIVQRDSQGRELSRVRQSIPTGDERAVRRDD